MQTSSDLAKAYTYSDRLDQIFQELFKLSPNQIRNEMTRRDVEEWDSLRHMELILNIEKNFGFELSFDDISKMQNIGEIRKIIAKKIST